MSSICENIEGTYLAELLNTLNVSTSDIWAVVCCGDDLKHPYDRWSGVVALPVFDGGRGFEAYFGDFSESLRGYENVPEYRINRDMSKLHAFNEFKAAVSATSKNPVFISANIDTWVGRILQEAVSNSTQGSWDYRKICLRPLYSLVRGYALFTATPETLLALAKPLPKTYGLYAMAADLDITVPMSSTKAMQRAQLTAEVARTCLLKPYPL